MTLTLYSWPESGNSYKVRLLASLLDIPLIVKDVNFLNLEQQSASFLKLNAKAEVPTLDDDGLVLTDSSSILTYLAAKYAVNSRPPFWSDDLLEQVRIIEWLAFANGWVQHGVFTARAILSYGGPYNGLGQNGEDEPALRVRLQDAKTRSYKSLRVIDDHLGQHGGWLVGNRPTIADISNFVYIALAPMGDIKLDEYRHVLRWIATIKSLEGFISIPGLDDPLVRRRGTPFEADTNV